MKVKELIERLKTFPQDAKVLVFEQTHPMDATSCEMFGEDVAIC